MSITKRFFGIDEPVDPERCPNCGCQCYDKYGICESCSTNVFDPVGIDDYDID